MALRGIVPFLFDVPSETVKELGIALGHDDRGNVDEETKGNDPERMKANAEGGGHGSVEDGDSPGNAAYQDLFRQRPVDGNFVSVHASPLEGDAAGEAKKRQTETGCGKRDGQTEDDG